MFAVLVNEHFVNGLITAEFNVKMKTVKVNCFLRRQQTGMLSGNISSFLHFKLRLHVVCSL